LEFKTERFSLRPKNLNRSNRNIKRDRVEWRIKARRFKHKIKSEKVRKFDKRELGRKEEEWMYTDRKG